MTPFHPAAAALTASLLLVAPAARADDTINRPDDHPDYPVEIEPHGVVGWTHYNYAPDDGVGVGARFSIPVVKNGFVSSINDSVAISFGLDWVHYDGAACYYLGYGPPPPPGPVPCYAVGDSNYLFFPLALQWNFFVARQWSVFAEPGLVVYHGFFDYCSAIPAGTPCANPHETGADLAFYLGGRFHFGEHAALTMRLGFPTLSVGVSFM